MRIFFIRTLLLHFPHTQTQTNSIHCFVIGLLLISSDYIGAKKLSLTLKKETEIFRRTFPKHGGILLDYTTRVNLVIYHLCFHGENYLKYVKYLRPQLLKIVSFLFISH